MMESEEPRELVDDHLSRTATRFGRRGRKSLYEAPEFTKRLNAFIEATAGEDVKFECEYKGFPRPTLRWYRDDELIPGDERYVFEECDGYSCLSIARVGKGDEAAYKCKAENSEGVTSTTGYLSVSGDLSDKPLSCQGRQSEHAVSNPPPLRTIIEQKSMEEREEDAYPQASTSPVDEILEEAAMKGHGWPAMLGLKKKRERRNRQPNEEDYDSGSDTSVESQQDDRVNRVLTPDADLVINEDNLLPYDGPLPPDGGGEMMQTNEEIQSLGGPPQNGVVTNGTAMVEETVTQKVNGDFIQDQQQMNPEQHEQQINLVQAQDANLINPMEVETVNQANQVNQVDQVPMLCQAPSEPLYQLEQEGSFVQSDLQSKNGFAELQHSPPEYCQIAENNIIPEMQTAPAMASPTEVLMEFTQPRQDIAEAQMEQNFNLQQEPSTEPEAMQMKMLSDENQVAQVPESLGEVSQQAHFQTEMIQEHPEFAHAQEVISSESQPQMMQANLAQSSEGISEEVRDVSPTEMHKPDTEKQKSIESGYWTEDVDAAIQQEAAVTFTETMEVPVVRAAQKESETEQHASIFLGDESHTTPEVMIGSPVNLHVSLSGQPGQPSDSPIGIQLQGMHPQVLEQSSAMTEPDGIVQQAPPEVVTQALDASPQVYEAPANFMSLERAEVMHSPPRSEEQQPQTQVQYVSSVSSEINQPQVLPQSSEAVTSQPTEQSQTQERIEDENSPYRSASNPFRTSTENTNEEMLASYTRTFSSTIEEEENAQEVGEPLTSSVPFIRRQSEQIITLATVETTRPYHDWLPFPWLPMSLLVTISSFLAVAFEISPSLFVLILFFVSLLGFRFVVSKVEPKRE